MACKECRGGLTSTRVSDVRKLYNPGFFGNSINDSFGSKCKSRMPKTMSSGSVGKCRAAHNLPANDASSNLTGSSSSNEAEGRGFYSKNCDVSLLRRYERQPWFKDRIVQAQFKDFMDQLVTPKNIGTRLCPGPDDWEFKCHKARALIGPTVPCIWELPLQDGCVRYGINRDWRRYNDDQREEASEVQCGCNDEPKCGPKPKSKKEGVPFTGKQFGARYMSWGSRGSTAMSFPHRPVYKYQSLPQCS